MKHDKKIENLLNYLYTNDLDLFTELVEKYSDFSTSSISFKRNGFLDEKESFIIKGGMKLEKRSKLYNMPIFEFRIYNGGFYVYFINDLNHLKQIFSALDAKRK